MGLPDRTAPVSISGELPELTQQVRPLRPNEVPNSFAVMLTKVADDIRQLNTTFGIRPYRVFLVHVQWSGAVRGSGQGIEIARRELLPTPRVKNMESLPEILRSTGLTEEGSITVDQISAKYSEDDLAGRTPDLQDPSKPITSAANVEFYWEVVENRVALPLAKRRRFTTNGVPELSRGGFQWSVSLIRQDVDRQRNGGNQRGQF